jgi:hypothetical protein
MSIEEPTQINWNFELARFGLQALLTLLSAWWISWWIPKRIEGFKTRFAPHHQARLKAIGDIYPILSAIRHQLTIRNTQLMMPQFPSEFQTENLVKETTNLKEVFLREGVYFDEEVIHLAGRVYSWSLLLQMAITTSGGLLTMSDPKFKAEVEGQEAKLTGELYGFLDGLEKKCRQIISP